MLSQCQTWNYDWFSYIIVFATQTCVQCSVFYMIHLVYKLWKKFAIARLNADNNNDDKTNNNLNYCHKKYLVLKLGHPMDSSLKMCPPEDFPISE